MKQSGIASPRVRVTGQTVRDLCCSQWPVSSDLERSSKDQAKQSIASRPQDFQWSTTRTEQGTSLLTISVLAEGSSFWTSQIATPLDKSLFEILTLPQEIGIPRRPENTYNATPEPGYIVRQSLRNFISDSWPSWGRLPEREPRQLVLDQVLKQAC